MVTLETTRTFRLLVMRCIYFLSLVWVFCSGTRHPFFFSIPLPGGGDGSGGVGFRGYRVSPIESSGGVQVNFAYLQSHKVLLESFGGLPAESTVHL